MRLVSFLERHFHVVIVLLCLGYLSIQLLYITRTEFNPDEVQGAHAVHTLKTQLPYRDLWPYKTVLGYYLQIPVLSMSDDPWTGLLLLRGEMALLNTALLCTVACVLAKHFRKAAICLALLPLLTMSNFLEHSSEIRVDMLTSAWGLVSLLLLLKRRFVWAGVACALSFLVSQKGIYYIIASNAALAGWMLLHRERHSIQPACRFNVAMLGVLVTYCGFWTALSSPAAVLNNIFFSPYLMVFTVPYDIHRFFWLQTLWRNPLFYVIGLLHLPQLVWRLTCRPVAYRDGLLLVYTVTLMALGIWHKQPWPYFFVLLIPTIFMLHVSFFHLYLEQPSNPASRRLILLLFVLLALVPLQRFQVTLPRTHGYQKHMLEILASFLEPGDTYVDGMDFMYQRQQGIAALRWLETITLVHLHTLPQAHLIAIIQELETAPIKLFVHNVRTESLTPLLHDYLLSQFAQLWGNLYVYAPTITPASSEFVVKFSGTYLVELATDAAVSINGQTYYPKAQVKLQAGRYHNNNQQTFRLKFMPERWEEKVEWQYRDERPHFMAFRHFD